MGYEIDEGIANRQTQRLVQLEAELHGLRQQYDRDLSWWNAYQTFASNLQVTQSPDALWDTITKSLVAALELPCVAILELTAQSATVLSRLPAQAAPAQSAIDSELAARVRAVGAGLCNGKGEAFSGLGVPTGLERFLFFTIATEAEADRVLMVGVDARRAKYRKPFAEPDLRQFERIAVHLQTLLKNIELVRQLEQQRQDLADRLATISRQAALIRQLSAPVLEVWRDTLVLPIQGEMDPERWRNITQDLLARLTESRAKCIILDVTGMAEIDTSAANQLLQVTAATRLLGARCILTGVRAGVAMTLVRLGVNLADMKTFRDLHAGLADCLVHLQSAPK